MNIRTDILEEIYQSMNDAGAKRKSLPATAQAHPMAGRPACRGTMIDDR